MDERKVIKTKIEKLKKEVDELHPFLEVIFRSMKTLDCVHYTQGPFERGADFILEKTHQEFGQKEYVGVVVKVGKIQANNVAVEEQIRECLEKRLLPDGSKEVYLDEVWVASNGTISNRAKEKIHDRFKASKVIFLGIEQLTDLGLKYAPDFGTQLNIRDSEFLRNEREFAVQRRAQTNLLSSLGDELHVEQRIMTVPRRLGPSQRDSREIIDIFEEIERRSILVLDAPMGGGKSYLLNSIVEHFASNEVYAQEKLLPIYLPCNEFISQGLYDAELFLSRLIEDNQLTNDKERRYLLLFDGLDEVQLSLDEHMNGFFEFCRSLSSRPEGPVVKIVIATRNASERVFGTALDLNASFLEIQPLSLARIADFVRTACSSLNIESRLVEDLKRSTLFRDLPKTPIAAILLVQLLSEGTEEVPANLTELYAQYCELALGRWDITRGLSTLKEYEASDAVLCNLAAFMLENQLPQVGYSEALGFFSNYLNERELDLVPGELFKKVLERTELFVHDERQGTIAFRHRSFAEFFLAKAFTKRESVDLSNRVFHPYWSGSYFFYVGIKKDCPELLRSITSIDVSDSEAAQVSKIINLGKFLLAGYKSPYSAISQGVEQVFDESLEFVLSLLESAEGRVLGALPPIQLTAFFRALLRDSYSYPFFAKAINSVADKTISSDASNDAKSYKLLLLDSTRDVTDGGVALGGLIEMAKKPGSLPVSVEQIVCSGDFAKGKQARGLKALEKKVKRRFKDSVVYRNAVQEAFNRSLDGRFEYTQRGKRLEASSKHANKKKKGNRRR